MKILSIALILGFSTVLIGQNDTKTHLIQKGTSADAILYTQNNPVIGISIHFGNEVDKAKRNRVIEYIDQKIFIGENEAPVAFFIASDFEGNGIGCSVFVKGKRQWNPHTNQEIFNLTELAERAPKIVGVYRLVYQMPLNGSK